MEEGNIMALLEQILEENAIYGIITGKLSAPQ